MFGEQGVPHSPAKLKAIKGTGIPQNVNEFKSFLGMTSYCSRFISDYATVCESLRRLTIPSGKWNWNDDKQIAFETLKSKLSSENEIGYFDAKKDIEVVVDASPVGLGAILAIAFASRALTDTESRYSGQTERDA